MISNNEVLSSGIFDFPVFPLSENLEERGKGQNNKQILICITDRTEAGTKSFLEKVMASVGVKLGTDTFLIQVDEKELFRFSAIQHEKGFANALFFGHRPEQVGLNLNIQKYQPLAHAGQTFLFADKLEVIQQKPELKRPLWEALKSVNW